MGGVKKMKNFRFPMLLSFVSAAILSGCASHEIPPNTLNYEKFYSANPTTILVPEPVSHVDHPDAGAAFMANAVQALTLAGYYPMPVSLVRESFSEMGVENAKAIRKMDFHKLKDVFHADALMQIDITQYKTSFKLVKSETGVSANARLISLNDGSILWHKARSHETPDIGIKIPVIGLATAAFNVGMAAANYHKAIQNDYAFNCAGSTCLGLFHPIMVPDPMLYGPKNRAYRQDRYVQKPVLNQ